MNTLEARAKDALTGAEQRYDTLLDTVQARIAALPDNASVEDVDAIQNEYKAQLDAAEASIAEARRRAESAQRISEARAAAPFLPSGSVSVTESRTYDPRNKEVSYVSDVFQARNHGNAEALSRLQRNNAEVLAASGESRTSFVSADFYPPMWLDKLWVSSKRQRRVAAGLVMQLPLPAHGNTVEIPAYAQPTNAVDAQSADGQLVTSNAGSSSQLTAAVATVSGFLDIPRQTVERGLPGLDTVIFRDLYRDYNKKVDSYVINGSGSSGVPLGILNTSGIQSVTYSSGLTATGFMAKLANAVNLIQTAVFEDANAIIVHPRRWAWLISQYDSNGRPLVIPNANGPYAAWGTVTSTDAPFGQGDADEQDAKPAGWLFGIPVYVDANIPTTQGAGTNADLVLLGNFQEGVLFEDAETPREFTFEGVASDRVNLRLQLVGYCAFLTRYPAAFAAVTGDAFTPPSF